MKGSRCGGFRIEAGRESLISSTGASLPRGTLDALRRGKPIPEAAVRPAGASLLLQTAQVSGLMQELSRQLVPWRSPRSVHDPGNTVLDVAMAIALGGDCLADVAVVRAQPELFGAVASDPTISRLLDALGTDPAAAIAAIRRARAAARAPHRATHPPADSHTVHSNEPNPLPYE